MGVKKKILALGILLGMTALLPTALKAVSLDAEVTGLKAELKTTGTKPFNTESGKGRDTSTTDQIVRTFDEISYDISFATNDKTTPVKTFKSYDENSAKKEAKGNVFDVEVTATIPNVVNNKTTEAVWETSNFKAGDFKISSDKRTLTFYVRNMTVGQLYTKGIVLKVNDCADGKVLQPEFSAKIVGAVSGISATADKPVTVTTRTNLNVRLGGGMAANKVEVDGKQGRLHQFVLSTSSHAEIKGSRKGTTTPSGPIEVIVRFDLKAKNISTQEMKPIDLDVKYFHSSYNGGLDTFGRAMGSHGRPRGIGGGKSGVESGKVNVEDLGNNRFKITLSDYVINGSFPVYDWGGSHVYEVYSADYMNFISQAFEFFVPFYNQSDASYDVYSSAVVESVKYTDKQGNTLTQETATNDNTDTRHLPEYLGGSISVSSFYKSKTSPTWGDGNATAQIGEELTVGNYFHITSGADAYEGGGKQLAVFDGRELELKGGINMSGGSLFTQPKYTSRYGIGKVTKDEMAAGYINPDRFTWYDSLEDARAHEDVSQGLYISAIESNITTPLQGQGWPNVYSEYYVKIRPGVSVGDTIVNRTYVEAYRDEERTSKIGPTSNSKYTPSELDVNGNVIAGTHSPSMHHGGNTIKIVPYEVNIASQILNREGNNEKTIYQVKDGNIIDMKATPSVKASATIQDDITVKVVVPKGLEYVEGSSSKDVTRKTTDADGNTVLEFVYSNHNNNLEPITYRIRIPLTTQDRSQFEITTTIDAAGDERNIKLFKTKSKNITIISDASMKIVKSVDKENAEIDEEIKYTLTYANTSDKDYQNGVLLDILPFNGDSLGSNYRGTYTIQDIKLPQGVIIRGTNQDPSTIKNNPTNNGVTNWTNVTSGSRVTALKFEVSTIAKMSEGEISFVLVPEGNMPNDVYKNQYSSDIEGLNVTLKSNIVSTEVITRGLKGKVWFDSDKNGYISGSEKGIANIGVDLINSNNKIVKSTTTDNNGDYKFKDIPSGNYTVRYATPAGTNATGKKEDSNATANHTSLVDGAYVSSQVTLDKLQAEDKVRNFGVVPNIKVTKVMPNESVSLGSQATWQIKVSNMSKTQGIISEATIVDDVPAGIEVLPSSISHNGTYNEEQNRIEWQVSNLGADGSETVSFTGIIRSEKPSELRNVAMVKPYGRVPENTLSDSVEVPLVKAEKLSNIPTGSLVNESDEIEYTIRVSNASNVTAKNVKVVDTVPVNSTLVNNSITSGGTVDSDDVIKWTIASIAPNSSVDVKFKVRVNQAPTGIYKFEIHNTATVNGINTNTIEHRVLLPHLEQRKESNVPSETILEEGQELTYNIVVENTGHADKGRFTVTDTVPDGMTVVQGSVNEGGTVSGNKVNWNVASLAKGQSKTFTFKVTVDNLPQGQSHKVYNNSATVDGVKTNIVSHTLQKAIIEYYKRSDIPQGDVEEGQEIEYSIVVDNTGEGISKQVQVKDVIPRGTTYVNGSANNNGTFADNTLTWNLNKIPGHGSVELKFKVTVNDLGDDVSRDIINTATVNGNATNSINHVAKRARIVHDKSITNLVPGQTILQGQEIEYAIRVANTGAKAKNDLVVRDFVPEGTTLIEGSVTNNGVVNDRSITWTLPSLDANTEVVLKFKVTIDAIPEDRITGLIKNTATVGEEKTNEVVTPVDTYRKRTNKLVSSEIAVVGDTLNYRIEVSNDGSLPLEDVKVSDKIPDNTKIVLNRISEGGSYDNDSRTVSWTIPLVEPGKTKVVSFDVLILKEARNTNLTNTAVVDNSPTNEVVTEVVSRALTGNVWYDVNKDGKMQTDEYRIPNIKVYLLDEDGNPVDNLTTTTDSNGKYVFEDLQVGTYKVKFDVPKATEPTTVLLIGGDTINHTDETLISEDRKLTLRQDAPPVLNLGVIPVLELEKSVNVDYAMHGDVIEYTLKAINKGTLDLAVKDFDIRDLVPDGLEVLPNKNLTINGNEVIWHIDSLGKWENESITFQVKVKDKTKDHFTNQATIPQQPNVTQEIVSNSVDTPIVRANKVVSETKWTREGDEILYSINVKNYGNTDATDIPVSDTVSDKLEVKKLSISNGGKLVGNTINWNIKNLKAGETVKLSFRATIKELAEGLVEDTIPNVAVVSNHETNEVTTGVVKPRIEYIKSVDKTHDLKEGDELKYTVRVTNTGTTGSGQVVVTDSIPKGTTLVKDSISNNGYLRGNEVTWKVPAVGVGEVKELSFKVTIDELDKDVTTKVIENIAEVDGQSTNKVESIVTKGKLQFHKESSIPYENALSPNDEIEYKVVVSNTGARELENVKVKDIAPKGTSLVVDSIQALDGVDITADGEGNIEWSIYEIKPDEEVTLTFKVKVNELEDKVYSKVISNVATVNDMETNEVQNIVKVPHLVSTKESSVPSNEVLGKGDKITYTIKVTNDGEATINNVKVTDQVPNGTKYIEGGTLEENKVVWNLDEVKAGETKEVKFTVSIEDFSDEELVIENIAMVNDEPTSKVVNVAKQHKFTAVKSSTTKKAKVGKEIEYIIKVNNTGENVLKNVIVEDTIPEHTKYVTGSSKGELKGNSLHWSIPTILPGQTKDITFRVEVTEDFNEISNIAVVNGVNTNEVKHDPEPNIPLAPQDEKPLENLLPPLENILPPLENITKPLEQVIKPLENLLPKTGATGLAIGIPLVLLIGIGVIVYRKR